jgi:hypothetical protein
MNYKENGHILGKFGHMPVKNKDRVPLFPKFYPGVSTVFENIHI